MTPLVAQNFDDKGEITEANKSIQRGLASEVEEQSAQNKVIETAFRQEQAMEKMSLITKLLEVQLEPAGQWRQARKTLAGWHQKDKDPMGNMVRNYQGGGETTEQQGRHSKVHRFL